MRPAELMSHCPRCGASRSAGAVPVECPACGLVLFLNPAVAACVFLYRPGGGVLFIERAHDPARGKLAVPGGFLDVGESAEQGVARETLEEVGLGLTDLRYVGSCPNDYAYQGVVYPVVDLVFAAAALDPDAARPLDGTAAIHWRDPRTVRPEELAFPSLRLGLRRLLG